MSEALDFLAALVLDDGRHWAQAAYPAQWQDARAVLDLAPASPYNFLTRARGYSKTTDLAGITLAAMATQLPPATRLYALAADRDQGRLLVDAIRGFTMRTPGLSDLFRVENYRVVLGREDIVLEVLAADAPGAYGLRPAFLVVDELAQWADTPSARQLWDATYSAMAKSATSRLVVLTTAGDPAHWSHQIRQRAASHPLWRLHEVPGPPPWLDPARLDEQRAGLSPASYRRLFHNEWIAAEDRLADATAIQECVNHRGNLEVEERVPYVIGVDLGVTHDRAAVAVCHLQHHPRTNDELEAEIVVVDRLEVWEGTPTRPVDLGIVEQFILDAAEYYNRAAIIIDPWQAIGIAQRLRHQKLNVTEFNFSQTSNGHLASTLLGLLRNRLLALPDDAALLDELTHLRIREPSPGIFRIDHDPNRHNDRAIALLLAAQHLLSRERPRTARLIRDDYHPEEIIWQGASFWNR
jgi:phage terminase large subunit-like protein